MNSQLISNSATLLDALASLDRLSGANMVLFVVDADRRVRGSLTDGDIRRALLRGAGLDSPVCDAMHSPFAYLRATDKDHTDVIRQLRARDITVVPLLDDDHRLLRIYNLKELHTLLPVDAVLMAGGKGERLRPLTEKTPKPLLPVGGKAIIDHNIDRLISYGVEHISVTVNYLKEQLHSHFAQPRGGVKIETVEEPRFLGTMGSVRFIPEFHNDTLLVMNSDLFTNLDYEEFYRHFRRHDADMSVAAVPYSVSVPYGIMDLDGRELRGIVEKPTYNYYANGGIYLLKREVLDLIPDGEFFNATDLIEALIAAGRKVIRFPIDATWIDIGNPQEYAKARELAERESPAPINN